MIDLVLGVLTPAAVFLAIVGGAIVGFVLLAEIIQSDHFGTARPVARLFGALIAVLGIVFGGVFYAGQIAAAIADGDLAWPRAAARYALWVLFCLSAGVGTWAGLRREWHR
jgi:hypothetical protein